MVLYGCELHAAINSCKVSNRRDAAHTETEKGDAIWVAASISFGWNCTFLQENAGISFWDGFVTLSNLANGPSISRVKGTGSGGAVGPLTHTLALLHPASRQQPCRQQGAQDSFIPLISSIHGENNELSSSLSLQRILACLGVGWEETTSSQIDALVWWRW